MQAVRRFFAIAGGVFLLMNVCSETSCALGTRDTLSLPLEKIYEQMLAAAVSGDFDRVKNALNLVKPVSQEITQTLNVAPDTYIQKAIDARDKTKVESAVVSYVAYGAESLLSQSRNDAAKAHEALKAAYREYLSIDKHVQKSDFPLSGAINNGFRKASAVAGAASYAATCKELEQKLDTVAKK
jgi:hypothetical protein